MTPEEICRNYNSAIVVRRWAATWLDFLLFIGLFIGLASIFGEKHFEVAFCLWMGLILLYYPLLEGLTGSTFGKWICRLKVVDAQGATPGILKATIRTLIRLVEVNPFLMGGLPAGIAVMSSQKRQRLGDMAANTYVLGREDLPYLTMPRPVPPPDGVYGVAPPYAGAPYSPYPTVPPVSGPYVPPMPWTPPAYPLPPTYPEVSAPRPMANARGWAIPAAALVTLVAIGLIWGGVYGVQREMRTSHPITMSCEQFLKAPPKEGWYHLTDCEMDIADSAYETVGLQIGHTRLGDESSGRISDVYIPVYSPNDEERKKNLLLVKTKDKAICRLMTELRAIEKSDEKKIEAWTLEHYDELEIHKDITGTIQSDIEIDQSKRNEIAKLQGDSLASDFVIIKEGDTPTPYGPIMVIFLGVIAIILAIIFWCIALVSLAQRTSRSASY